MDFAEPEHETLITFSQATPITTSPPSKRLRSCLSPTRSSSPFEPYAHPHPPSSSGSRSTSFSSCTSEVWKRAKSVRWQEMNGCAVTSTHDTWSHEEYDRTPLEPPTTAERACVLPERGSRCLSLTRDCFLSDWEDEEMTTSMSADETSSESFVLHTPPPTEDNSDEEDEADDDVRCHSLDGDEGEVGHVDEDKEWEECMERRRMMFARMCPREEGDRHPEFEGYRSISATLAELLRKVGCTEDGEADSGEQDEAESYRDSIADTDSNLLTPMPTPFEDHTEMFANLHELPRRLLGVGTPSLISSEGSEADCCIASPAGVGISHLDAVPSPDLSFEVSHPLRWVAKDEVDEERGRSRMMMEQRS